MKRVQSMECFAPSKKMTIDGMSAPSLGSHRVTLDSGLIQVKHYLARFQLLLTDFIMVSISLLQLKLRLQQNQDFLVSVPERVSGALSIDLMLKHFDQKLSEYSSLCQADCLLLTNIRFCQFLESLPDKLLWLRLLKQPKLERDRLLSCGPVRRQKTQKMQQFIDGIQHAESRQRQYFQVLLSAEGEKNQKMVDYLRQPKMLTGEIHQQQAHYLDQKNALAAQLSGLYQLFLRCEQLLEEKLRRLYHSISCLLQEYPSTLEIKSAWPDQLQRMLKNLEVILTVVDLPELLSMRASVRVRTISEPLQEKAEGFGHFIDLNVDLEREYAMQLTCHLGSGYFHGRLEHLMALNYIFDVIGAATGKYQIYAPQTPPATGMR